MADFSLNKNLPASELRRLTIEAWILAVSSHPPKFADRMRHATETVISSDEEEPRPPPHKTVIPAASTSRSKRPRTDSQSSDLPELTAIAEAQIGRIEKSKSAVYELFEAPILKDVRPTRQYLFKCKRPNCGKFGKQAIGTMETTGLSSHLAVCAQGSIRNGSELHEYGFTTSIWMSASEVCELFALWIAESARAYRTVKDQHLPSLLHPDALKHKPAPKTLSLDIKHLYKATQEHITTTLAAAPGVFHIGLDMFQTDSGFDFLSIVVFRQSIQEKEPISVKRFLLECLSHDESHTGVELAKATLGVLKKFGIQDRVWGVVCNNASNNSSMMDHLKKKNLKRLTGPLVRIHCMLHVLTLVAKAVIKPFTQTRQRLMAQGNHDANSDDDGSNMMFSLSLTKGAGSNSEVEANDENADDDDDDDGTAPSQMLDEADNDDDDDDTENTNEEAFDFVPLAMIPGSDEEAIFKRSTKVIYQIAQLAHKLRYNPRAKAAFIALCVQLGLARPHNIPRDMKIRWNSTDLMLEAALCLFDAILEFQANTDFMPRRTHLREDDQETIDSLLSVLKPIRTVSDILSSARVPVLADVIPHYDALNHECKQLRSDSSLALFVQQAAHRAWVVLHKYYQKTDESELYQLAVLLHPSMRVHYLKAAGWEPEWIENAVEIAVSCWKKHYRPQSGGAGEKDVGPVSQFMYSNFLNQMFSTDSESRRVGSSSVHEFVHAQIIVDRSSGRPMPVNPLVWWHAQKMARNDWDGLTPMALDILSAPATSVDVERAFSFAGSTVSKRRHSLAPYSIQAMVSLGSYAKAGLMKRGSLVLPSKGKPNQAGTKGAPKQATTRKDKGKRSA